MITVYVPGVRPMFEKWIRDRGGVLVWPNINMSNPGGGDMFTPAKTLAGEPCPKPHWSRGEPELATDIRVFRFVKEMKEVKRFRVAIRMGSQGMSLKVTDASTRKIRKYCDQYKDSSYRFDYDTQECVIEVPTYEEETDNAAQP